MDAWMLAFVVGAAVPVAIDVAGHALNRSLLLRAHTRLDEAEARGVQMLAKLNELHELASKPGTLRNGLDPRDAVELREQKKQARIQQQLVTASATEAQISEALDQMFPGHGPTALMLVKGFAGEHWEGVLAAGEQWGHVAGPWVRMAAQRLAQQGAKTHVTADADDPFSAKWGR